MAAAKKTNTTSKSKSSAKTSAPVAAAKPVEKPEHPRVARAKREGVYHLHTTKAGGVTQEVVHASERAEVVRRKDFETDHTIVASDDE